MHCSEEQLLSWLDGELPLLARLRVRMHLQRCWRCRERVAAYEREILFLTGAVEQWSFPGAEWKSEASYRLNRQFERVERSLPQKGEGSGLRRIGWNFAGYTALLVSSVLLVPPSAPRRADPISAISRAVSAEAVLFRPAIQEIVAVEIEELRPRRSVRKGRVEAISDPATGRFTADYRGEDGALKQALRKTDERHELVYQPSRSSAPSEHPPASGDETLASLMDPTLEPERLEAAFMRWLENRAWRPISFTAGLAVWARQDGTVLRLENLLDSEGIPILRVTARRTNQRQVVATWILDLNAEDYRPRLQTLRFEDRARALEIRLAANSIHALSESALLQIHFGPPDSLRSPALSRAAVLPPLPNAVAQPEAGPLPPAPPPTGGNGTIEALYALDRAGIWTGSGVEISETPAGVVMHSRSDADGAARRFLARGASLAESLAALTDVRGAMQSDSSPGGEKDPLVSDMRKHLCALTFLAARFGVSGGLPLSAESQNRLQTMFAEHAAAVNRELELLAKQYDSKDAGNRGAETMPDAVGSMAERLHRLGEELGGVGTQDAGLLLRNLRSQLTALAADYSKQLAETNRTR